MRPPLRAPVSFWALDGGEVVASRIPYLVVWNRSASFNVFEVVPGPGGSELFLEVDGFTADNVTRAEAYRFSREHLEEMTRR